MGGLAVKRDGEISVFPFNAELEKAVKTLERRDVSESPILEQRFEL